jgi:preprotein translocase subunit SecG
MSAVVFGCFAPDLEYFLWLRPHGHFGHTLPGVFVFDLPAALICLFLFHRYARDPLVGCLPAHLRERVRSSPSISFDSITGFALICVSILVGTMTHIFWDAFTHPESWIVQHCEFLRYEVDVPLFGRRSWSAVLQYISSAAGLLIILLWFIRWYWNTPPNLVETKQRTFLRDRIVVACAFVGAVIGGAARSAFRGLPDGVHGAQRFLTDASITGITIFCLAVLLYGFLRNRIQHASGDEHRSSDD